MKKLLAAITIFSFCTSANALFSEGTLRGVASIINATKNDNNFQQGNQNGIQSTYFYNPSPSYVAVNSAKEQTKMNLRSQGYIVGNDDIVVHGNGQVVGYVTKDGWAASPEGNVWYGPQDKLNRKISVPKNIKNAFKSHVNNNQQQQWGSVPALSYQSSLPILNTGAPADKESTKRLLNTLTDMLNDIKPIMQAHGLKNKEVLDQCFEITDSIMTCCKQQAVDEANLQKLRDGILFLARKVEAKTISELAEKFDLIVKSTFPNNKGLFITENVEKLQEQRKSKNKRKREEAKVRKEEKSNYREDEGYYSNEGAGYDDEYDDF